MRLHRFYQDQPIDSDIIKILDEELVHQWKNVFRYLVGGQVIIFNGDGYDYLCMITELNRKSALLSVISRKNSVLSERTIGIIISLIKKDNMELIIQKATELGVTHIFPVISERSEKKSLNMVRAHKIAVEASEQSGRGDVLEIAEEISLEDLLANDVLDQFEGKVVFHPQGEVFQPLSYDKQSVVIAIGPEGGFSDRELVLLAQHDFKQYCLGPRTLRAETAAIVGATLVVLG